MKIVPQAFYLSPAIKKIMVDGDCSIIHKQAYKMDLDNQRLLSAHALTIVSSGALMVHRDEGIPVKINSGEMVLLPKGLYAITDLIPDDNPFEATVIFFNDNIVKEFLEQKTNDISEVKPESTPSKFDVNSSFRAFIDQTISLYEHMKPGPSIVRNKILEALHMICDTNSNGAFIDKVLALKTNPKKELLRFMKLHFDKPLSVEQFAQLSGRSISSFRRDFRQSFKVSPKKWLIHQRLNKAEILLIQERITVTDAALSSGFTDIPHFIRSFNKQFLNTPKQYLLSKRDKNQSN
ncbi:helix-turn-helix transcriptional regulator [Roseivirga sp. E12]|uniref:helix-turn-helix transcriptional regulator n=1 Tax=Roseivirga sp. E12 TaxID=2819237 RepID=UPI001ABD03C0|nr:helix-turn-helix domain-containing protein [Roseivirga sp. E12]MBO3698825.1 helix-turn-helix transcriptional regulator [Roseivirga sp. E12]